MPEPTFEARLARQLAAYAQGGVRPIDRYAIAEATIAAGAPRGLTGRLGAALPTAGARLAPRILVVLLALVAMALALWIVGRQHTSVPPGRIAYIQRGDVWVAESDGSRAIKVLDDPVVDFERVTKMADADLVAAEAQGVVTMIDMRTGQHRRVGTVSGAVSWAPGGGYAFVRVGGAAPAIVIGDAVTTGASAEPRVVTPDGPFSDILGLSPDGRSLATVLNGTVYLIDASTGATSAIGTVADGEFGGVTDVAWSPDSHDLVIATQGTGSCDSGGGCVPAGHSLIIVDVSGGQPRRLIGPEPDDATTVNGYAHLGPRLLPRWSPDGRWIAFRASPGLSIIRPDGTDRHDLVTSPVGWFDWALDSSGLTYVAVNAADDAAGDLSWIGIAGAGPRSLGVSGVANLAVLSLEAPVPPAAFPTTKPMTAAAVPSAPAVGSPVDASADYAGLASTTGRNTGGLHTCHYVYRVGFGSATATPEPITDCYGHTWISPDGLHVAVQGRRSTFDAAGRVAATTGGEGDLAILDLRNGTTRPVSTGSTAIDRLDWSPVGWSPGGNWLALRGSDRAVVVSADGSTSIELPPLGPELYGAPSWSPDDSHVAIGTPDALMIGEGGGANLHKVGPLASVSSWSRDGSRYVVIRDGDAWVGESDGSAIRNVTEFPFGGASSAALSPDGRTLAVIQGQSGLWLIGEGTRPRQVSLGGAALDPGGLTWSPDGRHLAVAAAPSDSGAVTQMFLVSPDGSAVAIAAASGGTWSPDGHYLAVASSRDGQPSIDVMAADGSGRTTVTSGPFVAVGQLVWLPKP